MAEAIKCDRCGKYYEENIEHRTNGSIIGGTISGIATVSSVRNIDKWYDLCDSCLSDLKKFMGDALKAHEDIGLTPEKILEIDRLYSEQCKELERYRKWQQSFEKVIRKRIQDTEKIIAKEPADILDEVANDTAEAFIEAYKDVLEIVQMLEKQALAAGQEHETKQEET